MRLQHIDIIAGNLCTKKISANYPGAWYWIAAGVTITWVAFTLYSDSGDHPFKITTDANISEAEIFKVSSTWDLHISLWTWVEYKDEIVKGWRDRTISIDVIHSDIQKQYQEITNITSYLDYIFINEDQYWFLNENIPVFDLNPNIILFILSYSGGIEMITNWEKDKFSPVFLDKIEVKSSIWAKDVFIWAFLWLKKSWFSITESVKLASLLSQKSMVDYGVNHLIKPTHRPKVILIVWPSGAGKTTFIDVINKEYERLNDLHPLKEIFLIDGSEEISKIDENSILYFKDYLTKRKWWSNGIFSQFNGDGYDILEPEVWDEILLRLIEGIHTDKKYILEFSRWKDINHQQKKWYDLASTYNYFLQLAYNELKKKNIESSDIITLFIDSDMDSRLERNRVRKEQGLHYVSERTIHRVYAESLCPIEWNISIIEGKGGQDGGLVLYRINNSIKTDPAELSSFFLSEFDKAMKIFNISNILS